MKFPGAMSEEGERGGGAAPRALDQARGAPENTRTCWGRCLCRGVFCCALPAPHLCPALNRPAKLPLPRPAPPRAAPSVTGLSVVARLRSGRGKARGRGRSGAGLGTGRGGIWPGKRRPGWPAQVQPSAGPRRALCVGASRAPTHMAARSRPCPPRWCGVAECGRCPACLTGGASGEGGNRSAGKD